MHIFPLRSIEFYCKLVVFIIYYVRIKIYDTSVNQSSGETNDCITMMKNKKCVLLYVTNAETLDKQSWYVNNKQDNMT